MNGTSRLARLGFIDVHRTSDPVRRRVRSRGVPPALVDHEIFYTEDVREAGALLGRALSPASLDIGGIDSERFAASLHGIRLRDVSMLHLDLGVTATLDVPVTGPYYAVHMPTNGRATGTYDGTTYDADPVHALVTSPGAALTMRFAYDSPQLVIRIEQQALERHLTRLLGGSLSRPIAFTPGMDLTTDAAMRWNGAIQLLHTEVYYPGSLVHRGQGISSLEELLMSTLLLLQPSNHHAHLVLSRSGDGGEPAARRVVRESQDYIEGHLREHVSMADIAGSVHMSVRAIQLGFREELGTTPMEYLRDRRLERAHEDLVDATASDGVTVTDVAQRWGFAHLGSFAALYRRRWGEAPSQTLRR
ncbi:AraC family transcriptional regulator [Pseudonocardia abyssalis]|uniref:AraC family transcriptional regulator n=1 Tax=Pseudonocardia abyssalis TaxID=2792008 RepID=A0ABS6UV19_9PSEU|nr:AraC family transcriptional regulator [Pseudonocardia abyssalis]MBW0116771.1 AraC family transcriptional regulator [Pseudonocardia abyssalis]MBW0136089.1 AraC family transcriptional regulator [Pseudonocardia abyssalis]